MMRRSTNLVALGDGDKVLVGGGDVGGLAPLGRVLLRSEAFVVVAWALRKARIDLSGQRAA